MNCRYCHNTLTPLRSLTDGEFCCDEHRIAYEWEAANTLDPKAILADGEPAAPQMAMSQDAEIPVVAEPVQETAGAKEAVEATPQEDSAWYKEQVAGAPLNPLTQAVNTWRWLTAVWKNAPFELKVITLLLPVLVAVAITPSKPRPIAAPEAGLKMRQMVDQKWKYVQQNISNRAAIAFTDDFRSGLDAWNSHSKLTRSWSYDAAGFVEPGPLAIFKPTADLSDYRFEFLGEIDHRAMGFAFRAKNLDNYYAVKFVTVQPGPLPVVHILRYAVINGREGPRVEKPLPLTTRADMFYRVAVDVRGGDFTILVQDQVVDFWSDNRLRQGGVGFFCARGERARLRWVEVTHQYDALGKLCAFLAPYSIEESN